MKKDYHTLEMIASKKYKKVKIYFHAKCDSFLDWHDGCLLTFYIPSVSFPLKYIFVPSVILFLIGMEIASKQNKCQDAYKMLEMGSVKLYGTG